MYISPTNEVSFKSFANGLSAEEESRGMYSPRINHFDVNLPNTLLNYLSDIPTLQRNDNYIQQVKEELCNKVKSRVEHFIHDEKEDILYRYIGVAKR